jgi:hypothetical protein
MRAPWILAVWLAACGAGEKEAGGGPGDPTRPFRRWPDDTRIAFRLPAPSDVAARPEAFQAFVRALNGDAANATGFLFGAEAMEGVAPGASPFAALTAGGWLRALPAGDMAALNRSLAARPPEALAQEIDGFLVLSRDARSGGGVEPPLPQGDLALRVRHHPLLAFLATAGDVLEAGLVLGSGGFDARARLEPGPGSPTAALLAGARDGEGGLLDFLPPSLVLRVETTFAPTFLASPVAKGLARHAGFAEEGDRIVAERLLREALTGADPATGIAFGFEARGGEISFVVVARDAAGPASPILAKLREQERSSFGPLVLDRRDAPKGLLGWSLWIAQATPTLEDLPELLWGTVGGLSDEAKGLPLAYASCDGWSILAGGPRADALAHATKSRFEGGSTRTAAGVELFQLRDRGEGDYVLGIAFEPPLEGVPAADRAALGAAFGAGEGARGTRAVAAAGFRAGGGLTLLVRALY